MLGDGEWGRLFQLLYLSIECFGESLPWHVQFIAIALLSPLLTSLTNVFPSVAVAKARGWCLWKILRLPPEGFLFRTYTSGSDCPLPLQSFILCRLCWTLTFPIILKLLEPYYNAFGSAVKNLPATQETWVRFLSQEDPLKEEMATHSSILTWRIP